MVMEKNVIRYTAWDNMGKDWGIGPRKLVSTPGVAQHCSKCVMRCLQHGYISVSFNIWIFDLKIKLFKWNIDSWTDVPILNLEL